MVMSSSYYRRQGLRASPPQINAEIVLAQARANLSGILDILAYFDVTCFTLANASLALQQLALSQRTGASPDPLVDSRFHRLLEHTLNVLFEPATRGGPQCWSTIVWSLATMGACGPMVLNIFTRVARVAEHWLYAFQPAELAMLRWGLEVVGRWHPSLLDEAIKRIASRLDMVPPAPGLDVGSSPTSDLYQAEATSAGLSLAPPSVADPAEKPLANQEFSTAADGNSEDLDFIDGREFVDACTSPTSDLLQAKPPQQPAGAERWADTAEKPLASEGVSTTTDVDSEDLDFINLNVASNDSSPASEFRQGLIMPGSGPASPSRKWGDAAEKVFASEEFSTATDANSLALAFIDEDLDFIDG